MLDISIVNKPLQKLTGTDRQAGRQAGRQTDRQVGKPVYWEAAPPKKAAKRPQNG